MAQQTKKTTGRALPDIWMVAREYAGLAEAGGVKDVVRQLAEALALTRKKITVVLPCYGFLAPDLLGFDPFAPSGDKEFSIVVDMHYADEQRRETVSFFTRTENRVRLMLCVSPRFTEKHGIYTYTAEDQAKAPAQKAGAGHYDYFAVNILLQKAAMELMLAEGAAPAIVHCHDGHAALLPAMARELPGYRTFFRHTGFVVTMHNAGLGYHQEVNDLPFARAITGLPQRVITQHLLLDAFDPLLAASSYAAINTVSENYARELQQTETDQLTGELGHALMERGIVLHGITNGIDPLPHDPSRPATAGVVFPFDPATGELAGKQKNRAALLRMIDEKRLPAHITCRGTVTLDDDAPLFIFIGRLTRQKGVDVLCRCMEQICRTATPCGFLVLGQGEPQLELELARIARDLPGRIAFLSGHSSETANRVLAAGDFIVIPSRFEPCGLTDYQGQLMGALPIVHAVGGLVKVTDNETGLVFHGLSEKTLTHALNRATVLFTRERTAYQQMQQRAAQNVLRHHTWQQVRKDYLALYQTAYKNLPT